jgi:heme-degrading monooxygenase HmoA
MDFLGRGHLLADVSAIIGSLDVVFGRHQPIPPVLGGKVTVQFNEMRPSMPQIQTNKQPLTQITIVESEPEKQAEALRVMTERARFMARQPGFVSISLHRSLDGRRIVNYVQWENRDLLRSAHQSPEFRKQWNDFDKLTDEIDPHLYEVSEIMDAEQ